MVDDILQVRITEYLQLNCYGRVKACKAAALAEKFNSSLREINSVIRKLRKDGRLIGSSKDKPHGYYIPANSDEVRDHLQTFKQELFDMLDTYRIQRKTARIQAEEKGYSQSLFKEDKTGQMTMI
jgi:biotin operon repressor